MNLKDLKEALLSPQAHAEKLVKDKANRQDRQPGMKAVLIFEAIILGIVALAAWVLLAAVALLAPAGGLHWGWFSLLAQGLWAAYLSPLALAWTLAQGVALAIFSTWACAEIFDWAYKRLHAHKGGHAALIFNAWILASLPWCLFLIIPGVGPFIAMAGSLWAAYQVARLAYGESDWFKIVAVGVVAMIPAAIGTWVLALVLGLVARPILAMDPLRPWLGRMADSAMAGPRAVAPMPLPGGTEMDPRTAAAIASGLEGLNPEQRRLLQAIAAAQSGGPLASQEAAAPSQAPATAAAARPQGQVQSQPAPAPRARAVAAVPAKASAAAPVAATEPVQGQAQAPMQPDVAAAPEPAAQPQATPSAAGSSVAGDVAKQVGSEAAKAGVDQAAKLLRLWH